MFDSLPGTFTKEPRTEQDRSTARVIVLVALALAGVSNLIHYEVKLVR